ncbi:DNA-(apurinic or apyrimidinic site) lyase [Pelagirhabdus alkalitolerans]|uniref:Formamidopyrimidine-DNA glycosylase n=1 Tax=Pelagirhabdus alkalitolerans TaxID=1612202 RepID=A0A1G6HKI5_9BACI|nr:DNA-formamidopyrimidine glycosylase [Pelagirhabdus alkalitolerans]SDB94711.1 DNA-(apurinic or apyrimidinic site) lyase [Pelagirhabdus alkalitolerans]
MPELPEVETIRKTLKELIIGERIKEVEIRYPQLIKRPDDATQFGLSLKGEELVDIKRKGKFLLFEFEHYTLVSHLRMEGKYAVYSSDERYDKHTHVLFHFESNRTLHYRDVRKFGTMHLFRKGEEYNQVPLLKVGPDPFEEAYQLTHIAPLIKKSQRVIKNILLDQTVIAGLGNIYVDETLYHASIHPMRTGDSLSDDEIKTVLAQAKLTLEEAVLKGGSTIRSYVNSQGEMGMFQQQLYAYSQEGQPCKRCGDEIEKTKVSNRGTHFCPTCQKLSS